MKNNFFKILCLFIIFITLGCSKESIPISQEPIIDTPNETSSIEQQVNDTIANMTLDEKIAQMLIITHTDNEVSNDLLNIIQNVKPGGFILMSNNFSTYEKTKKFISDLQENSIIPMIISTDQEGGSVQRIKNLSDVNVLNIPYMYNLGKTENQQLAYQVGTVLAQQLKALGINVVYAPVLDIYSNPDNKVIGKRSFGSTPVLVSNMALSLSKGLEDNGVIATYKHFPGHGDTATDSHYNLPVISKTYEQLKDFELIPFQNAIDNNAKIIMIGHLAIPSISSNTPASLSKELITDILINDMNYQGLIITDALNMGALTKNYTEEQIYTMTVNAGTDLLLMPKDINNAIKYIKQNISEERINQSVKKILTFKFTYLTNYQSLDKSYLNNETQQAIINQIPS